MGLGFLLVSFFFFLEEGLKQSLAVHIGVVQVLCLWWWNNSGFSLLKQRNEKAAGFAWIFCSRNLNSLLENKVSLFLVMYFTKVVEIKKIHSVSNREASVIMFWEPVSLNSWSHVAIFQFFPLGQNKTKNLKKPTKTQTTKKVCLQQPKC